MKSAKLFLDATLASIARQTSALGDTVALDAAVLDRSADLPLQAPGATSANGSCKMIRALDGWLAVNLPREDDRAAIPALVQEEGDDAWALLSAAALERSCGQLVERAALLGLAVARAGEREATDRPCGVYARPASARGALRVIDLSALWAGPLCGAVFAAMGADVTKLESADRPDTTARATPRLDQRLNGAKRRQTISFQCADGRAALHEAVAGADILITSARARALEALGFTQDVLMARNPSLIWIAITGHGWESSRVAFGDDAAVAGGLVDWRDGGPHFIGDAIADPLTGLAAADAALGMLEHQQAGFIDAALAQTAAYAASSLRVAA